MTTEEVRTQLLAISNQADWWRFIMKWRQNGMESLFHPLFELALSDCVALEAQRAADMLVELEPPCPLSLDDALRAIARSELNLSNKAIPFYLLTQFGPNKIRNAVHRLATEEFAPDPPPVLTGIAYWLHAPKIMLARSVTEMQWGTVAARASDADSHDV